MERLFEGFLQPKIIVYPENSNEVVNSQIIDGQNIYECNFENILIKVQTAPNIKVAILNSDTNSVLSTLFTNFSGETVFRINSPQSKARLNLAILIYSGDKISYKYKFVILTDKKKIRNFVESSETQDRAVEILKNHNYQTNSQSQTNFMVDLMELSDTKFDIKRIIYTNEHYPVFKFKVSDYDEFKLYIIGFNDYLFNEPDFIDGEILYEKDYFVFICKTKFFLEGKYMFVVRYFDSDGAKNPQEEYFVLWVKFDNDDRLSANFEFNEIYGNGAGKENKIVLFYINEKNGFDEIKRVSSDENGNFSIKLTQNDLRIFKTRKFLIRSVDRHGNLSKPCIIN